MQPLALRLVGPSKLKITQNPHMSPNPKAFLAAGDSKELAKPPL